MILSRLEDRGFIERIERGKYLIIPLGSEKGKYTLHEFVIGSYLAEPSAISYWSALHYLWHDGADPKHSLCADTNTEKEEPDEHIWPKLSHSAD